MQIKIGSAKRMKNISIKCITTLLNRETGSYAVSLYWTSYCNKLLHAKGAHLPFAAWNRRWLLAVLVKNKLEISRYSHAILRDQNEKDRDEVMDQDVPR